MPRMITGDIHFGKTSAVPGAILKTCLGILDICEEKGITELDILGDLLDNQTIISHRVLADEVGFFLQEAQRRGINVRILHGNHDGRDMETRVSSNLSHINLFGARLIDTICKEGKILYVPWLYDGEEVRVSDDDVVFGHLEINGFTMNSAYVAADGMDSPSQKARIYLGHFHKHQTIGNITYVGSPMQHSFGDTNCPKFVHILDDDTLEIIESVSTMHLFPHYITVDMQNLDPDLQITPDAKVRVLHVDPLEIEIVEKGMLEAGAKTVEIHVIDKDFDEIEDTVYESLTIEDAIVEIINARETDEQPELLEVHAFLVKKVLKNEKGEVAR